MTISGLQAGVGGGKRDKGKKTTETVPNLHARQGPSLLLSYDAWVYWGMDAYFTKLKAIWMEEASPA